MRCFGRVKSKGWRRCERQASFLKLVCSAHITQLTAFLTAIIGVVFTIIINFAVIESFTTKVYSFITPKPQFSNSKETYKILILPFHPRQSCDDRNFSIEVELERRLQETSERDSLQLEVMIDSSRPSPVTQMELEQVFARYARVDIILWGELDARCNSDSIGACIRYSRTKNHEPISQLALKGGTDFMTFSSLTELRDGGELMNQVDFIIYWVAGVRAMNKSKYGMAIHFFEKIPNKDPEAYEQIALCYYYQGADCKTIDVLNKGIRNFPRDDRLYFDRGMVHYSNNNYEESFSDFNMTVRLSPANAKAHNNLGYLLSSYCHEYQLARKHYERAINLDPNFVTAYANYAQLLHTEFNEKERTRWCYERIIELDSAQASAYNGLAVLLVDSFKEYHLARKYYETAVILDSSFVNTYQNFALLLQDYFKEYELARQYYKQALRLAPNYAPAYNNLALLEQHFGEFQHARRYFEIGIELDSNDINAHMNLAKLLMLHFGDYQQARIHYEMAIKINPEVAEPHFGLAMLLSVHLNDEANAKKHYSIATQLNPALSIARLDKHYNIQRKNPSNWINEQNRR